MKLVRLVPVSLTDLSPPDLDEALAIAQARVRARHRSLVDAVDWMESVYAEQERRGLTPPVTAHQAPAHQPRERSLQR